MVILTSKANLTLFKPNVVIEGHEEFRYSLCHGF